MILPPQYEKSEDAKTLCKTLWIDQPEDAFRRRKTSTFQKSFVKGVKAKESNPCLKHGLDGPFLAEEYI